MLILLRADNQGEGGTLSLLTLAQRALGRPTPGLLVIGAIGAALFFGDALITPAISVLSAVEGPKLVTSQSEPYIVPITIGIIIGLFLVQSRGSAAVAAWFGPIVIVCFIVMAIGGAVHIAANPDVLPAWQSRLFIFLARNAADASAYFHIPAGRVVEIGSQVTL